ncbi:MAG: histidine kinase [Acidobacteriota bacterium]
MNDLPLISASLGFAGALACVWLAGAITRRAQRNAEVIFLLVMLGVVAVRCAVFGADNLLYSGLHLISIKTHFILTSSAELSRILFTTLLGHFLALTYLRFARELSRKDEYGSFADPETLRTGFWTLIVITYLIFIVGIAGYLNFFISSLLNYESWASGRPPSFSGRFPSFFNGVSVGFWPIIQMQIALMAYSASPKAKGRIASWILDLMVDTRSPDLTSLDLSGKKATKAQTTQAWTTWPVLPYALGADEWKALLIVFAGSIAVAVLNYLRLEGKPSGPAAQAMLDLADGLLPLLLLLPVIYYKMRFVFFDVIIKRGTALLALVVSSAAYLRWALLPVLQIVSEQVPAAEQFTLIAGIAAFVGLWLWFYSYFNRALDRYLFARPNYGRLSAEIGNEMSRFVDRQLLLNGVTARLKDALKASYVSFAGVGLNEEVAATGAEGSAEGEPTFDDETDPAASVAVSTEEHSFGSLLFGERQRGQLYQSEDLNFLITVANQLAGMLQNFALRDERDAQARREQELNELATRSEVKALRAQINPHFLFNALNTLADLTHEDPQAAEATIVNLAQVFRFTLEATKRETVALGEELDFVRSYLEIERARFEDKLRYEIHVPDSLRDARIVPMLIQPLVENAVKHGIAPKVEGGSVVIRASACNGSIELSVEDNGVGFQTANARKNHTGIGLANVQGRIEKLFGPGHWQLNSTAGHGTVIKIKLGDIEPPAERQ